MGETKIKPVGNLKCDSCDKDFKRLLDLEQHVTLHFFDASMAWKILEENFMSANANRLAASENNYGGIHLMSRPGQRQEAGNGKRCCCSVCGKKFRRPYQLKIHSRIHTGEEPYVCTDCGKSFKTRSALNEHIKVFHMNKKPYTCNYCQRQFVHCSQFKTHLITRMLVLTAVMYVIDSFTNPRR